MAPTTTAESRKRSRESLPPEDGGNGGSASELRQAEDTLLGHHMGVTATLPASSWAPGAILDVTGTSGSNPHLQSEDPHHSDGVLPRMPFGDFTSFESENSAGAFSSSWEHDLTGSGLRASGIMDTMPFQAGLTGNEAPTTLVPLSPNSFLLDLLGSSSVGEALGGTGFVEGGPAMQTEFWRMGDPLAQYVLMMSSSLLG